MITGAISIPKTVQPDFSTILANILILARHVGVEPRLLASLNNLEDLKKLAKDDPAIFAQLAIANFAPSISILNHLHPSYRTNLKLKIEYQIKATSLHASSKFYGFIYFTYSEEDLKKLLATPTVADHNHLATHAPSAAPMDAAPHIEPTSEKRLDSSEDDEVSTKKRRPK